MKKSFPLLIAGCLIFVSLFGAAACSKDEDADLKKDAHKISAYRSRTALPKCTHVKAHDRSEVGA